jgi:hypothetical protein
VASQEFPGGKPCKKGNFRKSHLTALARNFDWIARSQKYKKAHKGSQAAVISRKSVFGSAAILAACNGRSYLAQLLSDE